MSNQAQLEQSRLSLEKRNKRQAAVLSGLLFAAVLVLCFFLTAFTIQDPPPGEQFVAVGFADLGSTEEAGGVTESEAPSEVVQEAEEEEVAAAEPVPEVPEAAEEVATQEESEVAVNVKPDPDPDPEPDPEPVREDAPPICSATLATPVPAAAGLKARRRGRATKGKRRERLTGAAWCPATSATPCSTAAP